MQFGVGQPMRRKEDRCFVTGAGRYFDDISLPGAVLAYVLRLPRGHVLICSADIAAVRA